MTRCPRPAAVAALLLVAAGMLFATAPDRIRLDYSDSTRILAIAVHHPTFAAGVHHIAKIAVNLNDSLVALQRFSTQTTNEEQITQCPVPDAKPGDRLTVTAVCSLFGTRTETLILPPPRQ